MKNLKLIVVILISFVLGVALSRGVFDKGKKSDSYKEECHKEEGHDEKGHQEEGYHEEETGLSLSKKSQELIDLKTKAAQSGVFKKNIAVVGQIAQDAQISLHVVSPVIGTIKEAKVQIGAHVQKDDVLCVVSKVNGEATLHEVKAPITGTIIGVFGKAGDRIDTVSSIYTIADLTQLWATFDIYEKDIAEIKLAQKVLIYSVAYPGKVFEGEVTFISPRVDADANTIKVRASIQNPDNYLKLGMFINADVLIESESKYIVLPQEAVYTINAKKIVCVKTAADKFEAREVKVQDENKEEVSLAAGVSEGEEIVIQNGFLLKSELLKSKMGEGCAE